MTRRRFNGLVAELGGSGLTSGGTTITFAAALTHSGGAAVPTLAAGDYMPLSILDSGGVLSEIVHLTAYTSAATTGTIVRGREMTTGVSHSAGDKIVQGGTIADLTDRPNPHTPNAQDDEFDGQSSATWTLTPTNPTTWDINTTAPERAYVRGNAIGGAFVGAYQSIPGAYPFTVITKVNSTRRGGGTALGLGLFLSVASPSGSDKIMWVGSLYSGGYLVQRLLYNSFSTSSFNSAASLNGAIQTHFGAFWLKLVATSATSIATYASLDGDTWFLIESGLNPGFTPGVVGVAQADGGIDQEGVVELFRVT